MVIDNRNRILNILKNDFVKYTTDNQHIMYAVQVLLRKKDGCELDNYPVYQKSINKIEDCEKIFDQAIKIAKEKNGRVYINASPKIKENISLCIAKELIDKNLQNSIQEKSFESIIYSVATRSGNTPCSRVIFDFDIPNVTGDQLVCIVTFFSHLSVTNPYWYKTPNGLHVVCDMNIDFLDPNNFDRHMTDKFKECIIESYCNDNHLDAPRVGTQLKTMYKNLMHKDSGNMLLYYENQLDVTL